MVSCLMVFWGGIVILRDYAKLIDFYEGIYGVMDFYEGIYTFMDFYEGRGRKWLRAGERKKNNKNVTETRGKKPGGAGGPVNEQRE